MKALINALTLAFIEAGLVVEAAKARAIAFVEDNGELWSAPSVTKSVLPSYPVDLREPGQPLDEDPYPTWREMATQYDERFPIERAIVHKVSVVGPDGLTDKQRAAVGGVGLCQNCQQPNNSHLPGCARASKEDMRAVTKDPLPPAV